LQTKKPDEFIAQAADCDALLNTYAGPITAEVMARMQKCKIIARYGIGVDTIDLDAATAAGIIVTNNPTYCIEEVAEHTMALLLACARTVAFGNIARQVAVRAAAFGMRVIFSDPFVNEGVGAARSVTLDTLLGESDFVSLHPPLTPQTRKMIGEDALGKMKRTAWLINCSRGPIVDTDALVRALDASKIAGCALDTTDPEPLPDPHPLRGRENVVINPHVAWYSEKAMEGLQAGAPEEVRRVLTGQWPVNVVNRAVRGKSRAGL
jgi:D-3-phosphoglycerate dehydrogenase